MTVHHARGQESFPDVVPALTWARTRAPAGDLRVVRDLDGAVLARR